jgi:Zn-finger nucleic acid-binding protein
MEYFCPRDQEQLRWRDFFSTGRWHCRLCAGTLALEAHLIQIPAFQSFISLLRESPISDSLQCPKCRRVMKGTIFQAHDKSVRIDLCESCRHYWFDPGELMLLQDSLSSSRDNSESSQTQQLPFPIPTAYQQYEKVRASHFKLYMRVASALLIGFNLWIYLCTRLFAHDYGGGSYIRGRALPPDSSAGVAIFFLLLSFSFPRRLGLAILIAVFFTFSALLVWIARL